MTVIRVPTNDPAILKRRHEPNGRVLFLTSSTYSVLPRFQWVPPGVPMSPKGIHLNSRRCNLRWTDLTITTLKGSDIHGKNQCSAPTGLDRIVPEFHGLHPRLFMVLPAGLNSRIGKPIENVEEPLIRFQKLVTVNEICE